MTIDRISETPKVEYHKGYVILKWSDDVYEVWGPSYLATPHRRSRDLLDTFKTRIEAIHFINEELLEHPRRERR